MARGPTPSRGKRTGRPPKVPDDKAEQISKSLRRLFEALILLPNKESWPERRLKHIYNLLRAANQELFAGDPLNPLLNAKTLTGWGRVVGLPYAQVHKYIQETFDKQWKIGPRYILRLRLVLGEVRVLKRRFRTSLDADRPRELPFCNGENHPNVSEEDYHTWIPFLDAAYTAVVWRLDRDLPADDSDVEPPSASAHPLDTLILDDPRLSGAYLKAKSTGVTGLWANVALDEFRERASDLEFLSLFLTDEDGAPAARLRWTLVTGAAGDGKTRLAIHFLSVAEALGFRTGFLTIGLLKEFDARAWRPTKPTLIIIDYPAQHAEAVGKFLADIAATAFAGHLAHPVRVLLLERNDDDHWLKYLIPPDTVGNGVRALAYHSTPGRIAYPISALTWDALLRIMRNRLRGRDVSDATLRSTLSRIDPYWRDGGTAWHLAPRPLIAAIVGDALAEVGASRMPPDDPNEAFGREDLLRAILARERLHFWSEAAEAEQDGDCTELELHENVLLIATVALSLPRNDYDKLDGKSKYLPTPLTFDGQRYRRMAGGDPNLVLGRLEPDLLGEFFVLDRLARLDFTQRQELIALALASGGRGAGIFIIRVAGDFPALWRRLDFLKPSKEEAAAVIFIEAGAYLALHLGQERLDDVDAMVAISRALLASANADVRVWEPWALLIYNFAVLLAECGHWDRAIDAYDELAALHAPLQTEKFNEYVAAGILNKAILLQRSARYREELDVYDLIVARFGHVQESAVIDTVTRALINRAVTLGRLDRAAEALNGYESFAGRYRLHEDVAVRQRVIMALSNSAKLYGSRGDLKNAVLLLDQVVEEFGTTTEPDLQRGVIAALYTKADLFVTGRRAVEAIEIYQNIYERFGEHGNPVITMLATYALALKAETHFNAGHNWSGFATYDYIIARLQGATEPHRRQMAVRTALWKADRLLRLNGKSIEASGMLNTIVNSFGGDKSIQIRECVACTLYNKAALLHWLGQLEGACELVDKLVSDYRSAPPLVRLWAAKGLVACADWLTEAHRHVEARERCEQIGDLYHDESWAGLARSQIQTLQWKNATVLREEVDTGGTSWDAEYDAFEAAVIVAKAAYSRAAFLVEEGRFDEAIRALTSLIETFSPYSHDALRTTVIPARIIRGDVECFRNNYLGARQDYDSVVDGIEAEDDSAFYTKALVRKAMILELSGLGDRARVVYVDAARRYGVAIDRDPGAYLGCLAASEVWQMALESAAVQARHIMDRWDFNKESERRERTVPVLAAIMTLLGLGGWYAEVLAVCDALIERCSKSSGEDDLLEWKVQALVRKVSVLVERAEWRSAIELYDSLESAYRNAADQTLRTCFASALAQEAFYLRRLRKD